MGLRRAGAYSFRTARPFTRKSKVQSKHYMKTVPPSKIVKFNMGDIRGYDTKKLNKVLTLVTDQKVQIRDNAIEALRQLVVKELDIQLPGFYFFRITIHPHHILRENRMLTGAGADRMQTGMQLSFGVNMGRAALLKAGQSIGFVAVANDKHLQKARNILNMVKAKVPCTTRILQSENK